MLVIQAIRKEYSILDMNIIIYQLFIQQKVVKLGPTIGLPLDQNQIIKQSKLIMLITFISLLTNNCKCFLINYENISIT